jgi:hypothetical protein
MTVFFRLLQTPLADKATVLREAVVMDPNHGARGKAIVFDVPSDAFTALPGSTFAYWVSEAVRALFSRLPRMASGGRSAQRTNSVDDNFRFARLHWEVVVRSRGQAKWVPWPKGGSFGRFHYDPDTVVAWDSVRGTYPGFLGTPSRPLERPASADLFFRPGLTFPLRSQRGFSVRAMPAGGVFGAKAAAVVVLNDDADVLLALLAVMNSSCFSFFVELQMAFGSYEVGVIQRTPIPDLSKEDTAALARLAGRAWSLKCRLDTAGWTP